MKKLVMALLCFVGVAACDNWLTKPTRYSTVDVVATTRNGEPIPGVSLELYTGPRPMGYGVTKANGHYAFDDVPRGIYGVLMTAWPKEFDLLEHLDTSAAPSIVANATLDTAVVASVHFVLLKRGRIDAWVFDADGPPLAGVPVKLYADTITVDTTSTDSTGHAAFPNLPFGPYGVVVTRPLYYRDYVKPGDSAYAFHDQIHVGEASEKTIPFALARCAGAIRVTVLDNAGQPVNLATASLYSPVASLGVTRTAVNGRVLFAAALCAYNLAVYIAPPAGFTVVAGRGSSFVDGIRLTNGQLVDVVFHVQRQP